MKLPRRLGFLSDAGAKDALNATGSAPIYAARAFCSFDGTGTPANGLRGTGKNISSITDIGAGVWDVNFTTQPPDANYAVTFGAARVSSAAYLNSVTLSDNVGDITVEKFRVNSVYGGGAAPINRVFFDLYCINVAVFW